ncbi:hypothetical protein MESS2_730199 [Mesorhizobium metallidurans STM 2683]|uniref:Uncharacterized protein n=1 Tax=Mesorhizobium metallidurans STM 2683 TaxID=1297569 RepID=M5EWJ0_9HYPH|nr:hypothetical protein MESS2_730199 [Mesorhizobium metallidurans STM 2683]
MKVGDSLAIKRVHGINDAAAMLDIRLSGLVFLPGMSLFGNLCRTIKHAHSFLTLSDEVIA